MGPFDPYHKWLGIPPSEQPPNHYRLLGVALFESDPEVIDGQTQMRMNSLRLLATGAHVAESQKLLNEIAAARVCLLEPEKKRKYDADLRTALGTGDAARPDASTPSSPPDAVPREKNKKVNAGQVRAKYEAPRKSPGRQVPVVAPAAPDAARPWNTAKRVWVCSGVAAAGLLAGLAWNHWAPSGQAASELERSAEDDMHNLSADDMSADGPDASETSEKNGVPDEAHDPEPVPARGLPLQGTALGQRGPGRRSPVAPTTSSRPTGPTRGAGIGKMMGSLAPAATNNSNEPTRAAGAATGGSISDGNQRTDASAPPASDGKVAQPGAAATAIRASAGAESDRQDPLAGVKQARVSLTEAFETVIDDLEQNGRADMARIVRREKEVFLQSGAVPWSVRMRKYTVPFLRELRKAGERQLVATGQFEVEAPKNTVMIAPRKPTTTVTTVLLYSDGDYEVTPGLPNPNETPTKWYPKNESGDEIIFKKTSDATKARGAVKETPLMSWKFEEKDGRTFDVAAPGGKAKRIKGRITSAN